MKYIIISIAFLLLCSIESVAQFSYSSSKSLLQSSIFSLDVGTLIGLKVVEPRKDNSISTDGFYFGFSHNSRIIGNDDICLSVYGAIGFQFLDFNTVREPFEDFSFQFDNKSVEYAIGPGITYLLNKDCTFILFARYGIRILQIWESQNEFGVFDETFWSGYGIKINYRKLIAGIEYLPSYPIVDERFYSYSVNMLRFTVGLKI